MSDRSQDAHAPPVAATKPRWHIVLWVAAIVFCVGSMVATQLIDHLAPGSGDDAKAMKAALEQRFGQGKVLRVEATIGDRVKAWSSNELPATVTVHVWGALSDPAGRSIYSCTLVRTDGSWTVEDVRLVVGAPGEAP